MDFNMREVGGSLVLLVVGAATGLLKYNKARSANKRDINEDRATEKETGLRVDLLESMRMERESMRAERLELIRQRDAAQEQTQVAWARQISDATRIATVEADNKYLTHELANVQTAFGVVKTQNERLREDMGAMRDELRKMRAQIEEMTARYGSKFQAPVRTDFGSLDEEPGQ
jgi:chromosome segregation ATPase